MTTALQFIDRLAASGRYHFTLGEVMQTVAVSAPAARAALRRLAVKGEIAAPIKGFHVIVPPEYRRLGCLPPDQFVPDLMEHLKLEYYVGLLSAAEFHGAAHQRPQSFQVMTEKHRRPLVCGSVRVAFIGRKQVREVPTIVRNTLRGAIRLSTPEATALDLAGYPEQAGGLETVATVLSELSESLDPERLVQTAAFAPVPWAQRLGYLLEIADQTASLEPLADYVHKNAREYVLLHPKATPAGAERSARWRLIVNAAVEVET